MLDVVFVDHRIEREGGQGIADLILDHALGLHVIAERQKPVFEGVGCLLGIAGAGEEVVQRRDQDAARDTPRLPFRGLATLLRFQQVLGVLDQRLQPKGLARLSLRCS